MSARIWSTASPRRSHSASCAERRGVSPDRRGTEGRSRAARRLGRRTIKGPQTVEAYLRASSPPRYMQRLREMEVEFEAQVRRLETAYGSLRDACGGDSKAFASRWRAQARSWCFDHLNDLIRGHNAWYPVEANLPMNPRTRDYVALRGQSYRRIELGAEWILEHFPPRPPRGRHRPAIPPHVPREPLGEQADARTGSPRAQSTLRR